MSTAAANTAGAAGTWFSKLKRGKWKEGHRDLLKMFLKYLKVMTLAFILICIIKVVFKK